MISRELIAACSLVLGACCPRTLPTGSTPANQTCTHVMDADKAWGCPADNLAECEHRCTCNEYDACAMLGGMYEGGPASPLFPQWKPNTSRALVLYERACEGGSTSGCVLLGNAYQRGVIVPASNDRARAAFDRACAAAYSWGCVRLGMLELTIDRSRAVRALRRSCDLSDAEGCWILATTLLEGNDTTEHDEAVSALAHGCEKGTSVGSDEFSRARARKFALQACTKLGELKSSKGGVPKGVPSM